MKEISGPAGAVVVVVGGWMVVEEVEVVVEEVDVVVVEGGGLVSAAESGDNWIELITGVTQTRLLKAAPFRTASRLVNSEGECGRRPDSSVEGVSADIPTSLALDRRFHYHQRNRSQDRRCLRFSFQATKRTSPKVPIGHRYRSRRRG